MARRNDIDWQAIRREWETSALSDREIARMYGVHHSTMATHAMRERWKKDIVEDVRRGVAYTVLKDLGAKANPPPANNPPPDGRKRQINPPTVGLGAVAAQASVDAAVKAVSEHVARHIEVCDRALRIGEKLMGEIEALCDRPDLVTMLAEALAATDGGEKAKRLIEAAEKAASLPQRAVGFQRVQSGNSAAIVTIRTALGLDAKPDPKDSVARDPVVFNWNAPAKPDVMPADPPGQRAVH